MTSSNELPSSPASEQLRLHGDDPQRVDRIARRISSSPRAPAYDGHENHQGAWDDISALVARDEPFFVRMRADVLGVDFDKDGCASSALVLYLELMIAGYRPVLCHSGGLASDGQHRSHVFCIIEPLARRMEWEARGKALGGDPRTSGGRSLRPPGALHRSRAARSTPVRPATLEHAEQRLVLDNAPRRVLSARIQSLVKAGTDLRGVEGLELDRSNLLVTVVAAAHAVGWDGEDVLALLTCPAFGIARTYLEVQEARSWDDHTYFSKYLWGYVKEHKCAGLLIMAQLRRYRAYAAQQVISGSSRRDRATVLAVLEALVRIAERASRADVNVSVRDLLVGGLLGSLDSVAVALKVLQDMGLVRDVTPPDVLGLARGPMRLARRLELAIDRVPPTFVGSAVGYPFYVHETFMNRAGLGRWAGVVYQYVVDRPGRSSSDISSALGLTEPTVKKYLGLLVEQGLVGHVGARFEGTDLVPFPGQVAAASDAAARLRESVRAARAVRLHKRH
ncbi:MAG: hypothetical protein ACK5IM_07635 [Demequina sp.]|uniref:hypothetical protein n=1 Tax=Demequina sp. TaxID=2050685 RepID=UPI003A8BF5E1